MNASNDHELVNHCLDGDMKAFEELVNRYQRPLFNAALRMVHNMEDAEDITQSVFVKAYEKLDTYNPQYKFFSWVYRMTINESINFINREKRKTALTKDTPASDKGPEEEYYDMETEQGLYAAMEKLTPEYQAVIVLRHFHSFSYQEISDVVGVSEKTVKSRIYSARQVLREILLKKGHVA